MRPTYEQEMQPSLASPKEPTINFAVGPNCPVRCEGCYNHFGNTYADGGLVTASEVVDFAAAAQTEKVTQVTMRPMAYLPRPLPKRKK